MASQNEKNEEEFYAKVNYYSERINNFDEAKFKRLYDHFTSMAKTRLRDRCKIYKIKGYTKMDINEMQNILIDYFAKDCRTSKLNKF